MIQQSRNSQSKATLCWISVSVFRDLIKNSLRTLRTRYSGYAPIKSDRKYHELANRISNVTSVLHLARSTTLLASYKGHNFDSAHRYCAFNTFWGWDTGPTSQLAVISALRNRLNIITGLSPLCEVRGTSCSWAHPAEASIDILLPAKLQQWPYTILRFAHGQGGMTETNAKSPPIL